MQEPARVVSAPASVHQPEVWQVRVGPVAEPEAQRAYRRAKRIFDLALALLMLVVAGPIMALIALAIKLDSAGPVIFRQARVGYDPARRQLKAFEVYKFRTMQHNCDVELHRQHVTELIRNNVELAEGHGKPGTGSLKMQRDPRITRLGRLLRKTSLDEMPQVFNVIKGDMSLVGPRPALAYEVEAYEERHRQRLYALPGMTGWWQVMGRNRVSFEEMVCMDVYYIEHQCLTLDLRVLLMTPLAVLSGQGAG